MRKDHDVVVVGGGLGGVCAAVGAAKAGAEVLLVERYGFLGGMATAGLVNPFMAYRANDRELVSDVFREILDRLRDAGGLAEDGVVFDDEILKIILNQLVGDNGVDVLFHSFFVECQMEGSYITAIRTVGKSGPIPVTGSVFVDSTGDGDVAALAGAPMHLGRPEDGLCQPMTLNFRVSGITGRPSIPEIREELGQILLAAKERGEIDIPREKIPVYRTMRPDTFHFNTTRVIKCQGIDTLDLTAAEFEGRRQVAELFALFKRYSPRFEHAHLIKTATQIGVRESRRIEGGYTLEVDDVLKGRKFSDGIARACYQVDVHNPSGAGTVIRPLAPGEFYEVPYRCLVPKNVDNLVIGSRCISATHEAHGASRVMPVVSGIGEAAGIAAAWAAAQGIPLREIDGERLKAEVLRD